MEASTHLRVSRLDSPALLRGIPLWYLLRRCAYVLGDKGFDQSGLKANSDSEDPYSFSVVVSTLSVFLSHSWRDSRFAKYTTLLYTQNGWFAVLVSTLSACVALAWHAAGLRYPIITSTNLEAKVNGVAVCSYVAFGIAAPVWFLVFMCALSFGHLVDARWLWKQQMQGGGGETHPHFFLDKACICQTDEALKIAGVRSLGAIVAKAERMLCCLSRDYFERLWCNYEIAIFLKLRGVEHMHLAVVNIGSITLAVTMASMVFPLVKLRGMLLALTAQIWSSWAQFERSAMLHRIKSFCIKDAKCFCCSVDHVLPTGECIMCDREVVEESIRTLYGSLLEFDRSVNEDMYGACKEAMGQDLFGMPFLSQVILQAPILINIFERLIWLGRGVSAEDLHVFASPLFFLIVQMIASILIRFLLSCVKVEFFQSTWVQIVASIAITQMAIILTPALLFEYFILSSIPPFVRLALWASMLLVVTAAYTSSLLVSLIALLLAASSAFAGLPLHFIMEWNGSVLKSNVFYNTITLMIAPALALTLYLSTTHCGRCFLPRNPDFAYAPAQGEPRQLAFDAPAEEGEHIMCL